MFFLLPAVNVDSNLCGMLYARSILANIISVSSHPRITIAFHCNYPRAVWSAGIWSRNAVLFLSSLHSRKKGERERKKKKIAPKIECSRNKLNFAFGRSWNRVFVTYRCSSRCAFHFISFSLIRNFRRKCNIALRDAISKVPRCLPCAREKIFPRIRKTVTERHSWNSTPRDRNEFSKKTSFPRNHLY